MYDDLWMLPAMIALFRIVKLGVAADGSDVVAGNSIWRLLAIASCAGEHGVLPISLELAWIYVGNPIVWFAALLYLMRCIPGVQHYLAWKQMPSSFQLSFQHLIDHAN